VFLRRSLVTRPVGSISTSAHSQPLNGPRSHERPGRRRHHRDPVEPGVHCSVLRKRSISATSWAERASQLVVEPHALCGVPTTSTYRRLEPCIGFGATLENCIASTSVLKEVAPCSFLPRRVEECAISSYKEPTVDALAPGADEGRGWLRKATGSCLPSFDPWITEWGNPAGVMPSHSCLNI
jgi:hypothetical protein